MGLNNIRHEGYTLLDEPLTLPIDPEAIRDIPDLEDIFGVVIRDLGYTPRTGEADWGVGQARQEFGIYRRNSADEVVVTITERSRPPVILTRQGFSLDEGFDRDVLCITEYLIDRAINRIEIHPVSGIR